MQSNIQLDRLIKVTAQLQLPNGLLARENEISVIAKYRKFHSINCGPVHFTSAGVNFQFVSVSGLRVAIDPGHMEYLAIQSSVTRASATPIWNKKNQQNMFYAP